MAGEIVNGGQRGSIQAIQTQQTNFRIDRTDPGHFVIPGHGIRSSHIGLTAVDQSQATVFHDADFLPDAGTGTHGHQMFPRLLHRGNGPFRNIGTNNPMAVTGVDEHLPRRNAQ